MCGHAGFARQPGAKGFKASKRAFTQMMLDMERRGIHASGLAALGGQSDFIFKIAMKMKDLTASGRWAQELERISEDTPYIIGHTRWATLPNGHKDECAHPFRFGATVGAHNGRIENWKAIAGNEQQNWEVDSEAAIYLLDKHEDAGLALQQLTGGFALVWAKGGKLHFARNKNPMVFAYVPRWRSLFWCSEQQPLVRALMAVGVKRKEIFIALPNPMEIQSFDVARFDEHGAHADRAQFKGAPVIATTAKRAAVPDTQVRFNGADDRYETYEDWQRRIDSYRGIGEQQAELPLRQDKATKRKKSPSLAEMLNDMQGQMDALIGTVAAQQRQIERLTGQCQSQDGIIESLQAEIDHLFHCFDDAGLLQATLADGSEAGDEDEPPF